MNMTATFLIAFGGLCAFEGALWAIFPGHLRQIYAQMLRMADRELHIAGLFSVAFGVVCITIGIKLAQALF